MRWISVVARDGEKIAVRANGGKWLIAWHPPNVVPEGTPHSEKGLRGT
jgi:hypothetical protein